MGSVDSIQSNISSLHSTGRSETIDDVIKTWAQRTAPVMDIQQTAVLLVAETAPAKPPVPLETFKKKDEAQLSSSGTQTTEEPKKEETTVQPQIIDPYEDLDPWFKSSLGRFVAMLRKETVADTDEERYRIFTSFVSKETKLREVLYNIELEPKSEKSTPVPQKTSPQSVQVDSGLIPVKSEPPAAASPASIAADLETERYSPGGRPIIPKLPTPAPASKPISSDNLLPKHPLEPLTTNPPQPIYIPFRYTEGPQRGSDNLMIERPVSQAYSALRHAGNASGRMMSNVPSPSPPPKVGTTTPALKQSKPDEKFIGLIREKSVAYRDGRPDTSTPPPLPGLPGSLSKSKPSGSIEKLRSLVLAPPTKQSEALRTMDKDVQQVTDEFNYIKEAVNLWETAAQDRRKKLEDQRHKRQEESEGHIDALFNEKRIGYADINTLEEDFRQTEARVQLDEERHELDDFVAEVFDPLDERLTEEISKLRAHYDTLLDQLKPGKGKTRDPPIADKYPLAETMKMVMKIYPKLELRYQKRLDIGLERERRRKKAERRPHVFIGDSPALKRLDGEFDQMERRNIFEAAKSRDDRANLLMDAFDDAIMRGLGENQRLLDELSSRAKKLELEGVHSSGLPDTEVKEILNTALKFVGSVRADSESMLRSFGLADSALNDADYSVAVAEAQYSNSDEDIFRRLKNEKKKEDANIRSDFESKMKSIQKGPVEISNKIDGLLKSLDNPGREPGRLTPGNPTTDSTLFLPTSKAAGGDTQTAGQDSAPEVNYLVNDPLPAPLRPRTDSSATSAAKLAESNPEHQERLRKALEDAKRRNAARNNA